MKGKATHVFSNTWWRRTSLLPNQDRKFKTWVEYVQRQVAQKQDIRKPPPRQTHLPIRLLDLYFDILRQAQLFKTKYSSLFTYSFCRKNIINLAKKAIQTNDQDLFDCLVALTLEPTDRWAIKTLSGELLEHKREWLKRFLNAIEPYKDLHSHHDQHESVSMSLVLLRHIQHTDADFFGYTGIGYSNISHFGWVFHAGDEPSYDEKRLFVQSPLILSLLDHKENGQNLLADLTQHIEFYPALDDRWVMYPHKEKPLHDLQHIKSVLEEVGKHWDRWLWKDMFTVGQKNLPSYFSRHALNFHFPTDEKDCAFFKEHEHVMADVFVTHPTRSYLFISLLHQRLPCSFYFQRAILGARWFEASLFAPYASNEAYKQVASCLSEKSMDLILPYEMMYASLLRARWQESMVENKSHFQEKRRRKL